MLSGKLDKIGVIGLGIIGSRVAENLRRAGKHVYVWSRTPKPEPNFLGSPAEIANVADVIQIFVTDGDALIGILEKMEADLKRGQIVLNHATVHLEATQKAASIVRSAGATFIDAPFTGSRGAAENAQLVYYVGAEPSEVDSVRPLLDLSSRTVLHVGGCGDATVLKVATNMISAATVEVLCEALAVSQAHGVSGQKLMEALAQNACCSDLVKMKLPTMLQGDYQPHFSLNNMFKDAQIALEMANSASVELPALSTTASMMFQAIQQGHGAEDYSALWKRFSATTPPPPES